jgi:AraC-like DNA-binding protein
MDVITTRGVDPASRSAHWHQAIAGAYFPLDLKFRDPERFTGDLAKWTLGGVSLSRLRSEALAYYRLPRHLRGESDEQLLITVPVRAPVYFSQAGRDVTCAPGGYIIECGHEPYEFSYGERSDLWVMKVDAAALRGRIRAPERFYGMQFNGAEGVSGLFVAMLHQIPAQIGSMSEEARDAVGQQLVDLLALSIRADERTLTSGQSSVRAAHLSRVETFVRANLHRRDLDPEMIARRCGISVRYLHEIFRDTNQTLGQWVRDLRLEAAREDLRVAGPQASVAEICFARGFGDLAHFTRLFKGRFGKAPGEYRKSLHQV